VSCMPQLAKWANRSWKDSSFDSPLLDNHSDNCCVDLGLGGISSYISSKGNGSARNWALSLQFSMADLVSAVKSDTIQIGSNQPLAGLVSSVEATLYRQNQSSRFEQSSTLQEASSEDICHINPKRTCLLSCQQSRLRCICDPLKKASLLLMQQGVSHNPVCGTCTEQPKDWLLHRNSPHVSF